MPRNWGLKNSNGSNCLKRESFIDVKSFLSSLKALSNGGRHSGKWPFPAKLTGNPFKANFFWSVKFIDQLLLPPPPPPPTAEADLMTVHAEDPKCTNKRTEYEGRPPIKGCFLHGLLEQRMHHDIDLVSLVDLTGHSFWRFSKERACLSMHSTTWVPYRDTLEGWLPTCRSHSGVDKCQLIYSYESKTF